MLERGHEPVECAYPAGKRGGVLAEALRCPARDGDADHLAPGGELGVCGCVDHDAFAGPGRPDQDGRALGPGEGLDRRALLDGQRASDSLLGRAEAALARGGRDRAGGAAAERLDPLLEVLFERAHSRGGEAAVGEVEHGAVGA